MVAPLLQASALAPPLGRLLVLWSDCLTEQELFKTPDDRYHEARRVMERYGWRLVTPERLAEQAAELVAAGTASGFARALVGAYCTVLYQGFVGERGAEQQRQACEELGRALGSILARNYPLLPADERADVTQNALERIWRARESCREPIAFLSFASFHLLSALRLAQRQLRRLGEPLRAPSDDGAVDIPDPASSPVAEVLSKERGAAIQQFIHELRRLRPRAQGQIDILALRWIEALDYPEIAGRLKISQASAQTRLSRLLAAIRSDPELLQRASDLGLDAD